MKRIDRGDEVVSAKTPQPPELPRDVIYTILMMVFEKEAFVSGEQEYRRLISFVLVDKGTMHMLPERVLGMNCDGHSSIIEYGNGVLSKCINIISMTVSDFFKGVVSLLKYMKNLVKLDALFEIGNDAVVALPPTLTKLTINHKIQSGSCYEKLSNLTSLKIMYDVDDVPFYKPLVLLFPRLKKLCCFSTLLTHSLEGLTSLESLRASCINIQISTLTNLTKLKQCDSYALHNFHNELPLLTKLEHLSLPWSNLVDNSDLVNLHNMRTLSITNTYEVTDEGLLYMTKMEKLKLDVVGGVGGSCFKSFCATLTTLIINNTSLYDEYLILLTQLKHLEVYRHNTIRSLSKLTTLQTLYVGDNNNIRNTDLTTLVNLTHLSIHNEYITLDVIPFLTSLKSITLSDKYYFDRRKIPPHITVKK
jgi:hypothetical protein